MSSPRPSIKSMLCLQVMSISFRRSPGHEKVLEESVAMALACTHELLEYSLYHRTAPGKFGALLAADSTETISRLMQELHEEWDMILSMEACKASRELLHQQCRFVLHQNMRELLSCGEQNRWTLNDSLKAMITAWHPSIQSSANLESVFGDLASAVQRSGRADMGSISGLMCVGIRGLQHRMGEDPDCGKPLMLEDADFHGVEIPALKAKMWSPSSAPN